MGIFSPVGRNLPATTSSELHHGDGVTGTENSSVQLLGRNSPGTLGVATTAAAATPTATQNVRVSAAASSPKDLNNTQDLVPDFSNTTFTDTSAGGTESSHLQGDGKQTSGDSPPGSVRNSAVRPAQQVCVH